MVMLNGTQLFAAYVYHYNQLLTPIQILIPQEDSFAPISPGFLYWILTWTAIPQATQKQVGFKSESYYTVWTRSTASLNIQLISQTFAYGHTTLNTPDLV